MRLLVSILIALSLGACSFKKNNDDKSIDNKETQNTPVETDVIETISQEQDRQAAEGILTEKNVSVRFEEMPDIGFYRLVINWPKTIRRMRLEVNDKKFTLLSPISEYSEIVEQNHAFGITLTSLDQLGADISTLQVKKQSPLDYLVATTIELTKNTTLEVQRLVFKGTGKIITHGYNLDIVAQKIYFITPSPTEGLSFFNASHIITHFPNFTASDAQQLLGSSISINAKEATGELRVALVGVDGQNGRSGAELAAIKGINLNERASRLQGADGENGTTRIVVKKCNIRTEGACEGAVPVCDKKPTNGEDGKKGAPGIDGENGWNAGSPGSLAVYIEKPTEFFLKVGKRKGQPGKGGPGSEGFIGGLGGKAGTAPPQCSSAKAGTEGPRGDSGKTGASGSVADNGFVISSKNFTAEIRDL